MLLVSHMPAVDTSTQMRVEVGVGDEAGNRNSVLKKEAERCGKSRKNVAAGLLSTLRAKAW